MQAIDESVKLVLKEERLARLCCSANLSSLHHPEPYLSARPFYANHFAYCSIWIIHPFAYQTAGRCKQVQRRIAARGIYPGPRFFEQQHQHQLEFEVLH